MYFLLYKYFAVIFLLSFLNFRYYVIHYSIEKKRGLTWFSIYFHS